MTEAGRGAEADTGPEGPGLLPEPVRLRVLSLAADALGQIPAEQLPASLRRVASFAPQRRARSAGTQIAAALAGDESFRDRVATQVRAAVPELVAALEAQTPPAAANPVEAAAVAYLVRTEDWAELAEAAREVGQSNGSSSERSDMAERLQQKLHDARDQLRAAQAKSKEQLAEVKRENAELRRKLADARQSLTAAEEAVRQAVEAQEAAQKEAAGMEADTRRLRARVTDLEADSAAARRSARDERDLGSNRARLLLDTLVDSVQGLRRELALPPVTGSPADAVEAAVARRWGTEGAAGAGGGQGRPGAGTGMALAPDDPALLVELLAVPKMHVVIDGYNVTKTAWSTAPLESQRGRLLNGLAPIVARNRTELTVVFDGADLKTPPPVSPPRGVRVIFSPPGVIADDVIGDLVSAEPPGRPVVVVSSDREVATAAYRNGARSVESVALVRLLARS